MKIKVCSFCDPSKIWTDSLPSDKYFSNTVDFETIISYLTKKYKLGAIERSMTYRKYADCTYSTGIMLFIEVEDLDEHLNETEVINE